MRWLIDASNVIGSRPDGWWRDRDGAARRLIAAVRAHGEPATVAEVEVTISCIDAGTPIAIRRST